MLRASCVQNIYENRALAGRIKDLIQAAMSASTGQARQEQTVGECEQVVGEPREPSDAGPSEGKRDQGGPVAEGEEGTPGGAASRPRVPEVQQEPRGQARVEELGGAQKPQRPRWKKRKAVRRRPSR